MFEGIRITPQRPCRGRRLYWNCDCLILSSLWFSLMHLTTNHRDTGLYSLIVIVIAIYTYKRVVCVCLSVCFLSATRHLSTLRRCLRVREQEPSRAAPRARASMHSESTRAHAVQLLNEKIVRWFSYLILCKTIGRKRLRTWSLVGADLGQLVTNKSLEAKVWIALPTVTLRNRRLHTYKAVVTRTSPARPRACIYRSGFWYVRLHASYARAVTGTWCWCKIGHGDRWRARNTSTSTFTVFKPLRQSACSVLYVCIHEHWLCSLLPMHWYSRSNMHDMISRNVLQSCNSIYPESHGCCHGMQRAHWLLSGREIPILGC